jgi:hypothetical protein
MLLFRSGQDVLDWCHSRGREAGAVFPVEKGWELAVAWAQNRLHPNWRPETAVEMEAVLRSLGFTSDFWRLTD